MGSWIFLAHPFCIHSYVSSLYPNFLLQDLSLTVASHPSHSSLSPSAPPRVSNMSTSCNWPYLALPPAPASVRTFPISSTPHLYTPNWRPPKPPHSGCCGCSVLSDPSLTSSAPDGSPPMSHTTVHLSSSQADLGHFGWQSPCKQGEKEQSQPCSLAPSLHRLHPCQSCICSSLTISKMLR